MASEPVAVDARKGGKNWAGRAGRSAELLRPNGIQPARHGKAAGMPAKEDVMERPVHNLSSLFAQLGHPSDEDSIACFIETHSPLADGVLLHEAIFWTPAQAGFLREAILEDADWAEVIDELNNDLRARH